MDVAVGTRSVGDTASNQGATTCNVATHLPAMAATLSDHPAVVVTRSYDARGVPQYAHLTFGQLESLSNRYANGLTKVGIARGTRTLLMVRPGFEFIGLTFALFKMGAVPIMIDPGMGVSRMLECIRSISPEAFVGIPMAHVIRLIRRGAFRDVKTVVTVGRRWAWGGASLARLAQRADDRFEVATTAPTETAAILFTSGATGPAKGVIYEHGMFDAQVRLIRDSYHIEPGEIDLAGFPLFALFNPALGMTTVVPDMDASRPALVDPKKIVTAIQDHSVTNTFGSPALWGRVAQYCTDQGIKLSSLRRILIAGAPVSWRLIEQLHRMLPDDADVHTPYGATEALPVSTISGREVMRETSERSRRGAGICVGHAVPDMCVRIIPITEEPVAKWTDSATLPAGSIGEIAVRGPVVTESYCNRPVATDLAKIKDDAGVWHRMGDTGYLDDQGRLWFCGRKAHRVVTKDNTLYSVMCEAIFNEHRDVVRTALVGLGSRGRQTPVLVVEPVNGRLPRGAEKDRIVKELLALGASVAHTRSITTVLFHRSFPVDVRHNAKINREALAVWAEGCVR